MRQSLRFNSAAKLRQAVADESRSTQRFILKSNYSQRTTNRPDFTPSLGGGLIAGEVCNAVSSFVWGVWGSDEGGMVYGRFCRVQGRWGAVAVTAWYHGLLCVLGGLEGPFACEC